MKDFDDPMSVNPEIRKSLDLIRESGVLKTYTNPAVVSAYETAFKASEFLNSSVLESAAQTSKFRELYDDSALSAFHEASVLVSKFVNPAVLEFAQNVMKSPMAEFIENNHILSSVLDRPEMETIAGSQILKDAGIQVNVGASINELFSERIKSSFSEVKQSDVSSDSDYVTVPDSTVKEICVPETIAIPIGNHRVRIRTDLFISILLVLIELTVNLLLSFVPQSASQPDEEQIKYHQAQEVIQQWQNHSILELLRDIDTSVSSQAEYLQELKESLEDQNSEIQSLKESDTIQNSEIQELWSEIQELKSSQSSAESSPDNTNVSGNTVPEE